MDSGGFQALAYRLLEHQKPYVDFLYHSGPVFPLTMALFMTLFGFGKAAIFAHLLFTSSAYILFTYWIAKKFLPPAFVFFILLVTTVSFHWFYPFPNFGTDALLWSLIGVWFLLRAEPFKNPSSAFVHHFGCALSGVLACFTKYNLGLPFVLFFFIVSFFSSFRPAALLGFLLGMFLTVFLLRIFLIPDFHAFLFGNLLPYTITQSNRIADILKPQTLMIHAYFPVLLVTLFYIFPHTKQFLKLTVLLTLSTLGAIIFFSTNSAHFFSNVPLLLGFILICQTYGSDQNSEMRTGLRQFKYGLAALFVLGISVMAYFSAFTLALLKDYHRQNTYKLQTEPLKGWSSPSSWGPALDHLVPLIRQQIPKTDSMAVLTEMEILYPLTGHKSFKGLPLNFFMPHLERSEKTQSDIRNAIILNPPDWIITENRHYPLFPFNVIVHITGLDNFLLQNYRTVHTFGYYVVLKKINHQI
ncbi:MAG TPA: hypothetical protein PLO78_04295 [Candidatus Omnitrophota bacterium]|nr:hypothetical protein [Candidatus Omnitrophota bacterium]